MEAAAGAEFVRRLRGLIEPDPQLQRDGLAYLDSLKASDTGWQLCVDALLSASLDAEEHVQFYCLQAVEHFVKTRYAAEAATAAPVTRHFVSGWVQRQVRYTFLDACLKKRQNQFQTERMLFGVPFIVICCFWFTSRAKRYREISRAGEGLITT